ncbi:MAG: topoisomerase IV, partial [Defluviitaleaceae bacterium]|nr:topoisomerase IV [Defluviitaleaceae bacterium]
NGKIAKITMDSYSTKLNRKKIINAYSNKDKIIFIDYILEDRNYLAFRDVDKALLFSTELIAPKTTKNSSGIQVLTLKKNSKTSLIIAPENFKTENIEYYRNNKIPSTGHFIIEADKAKNSLEKQITLF